MTTTTRPPTTAAHTTPGYALIDAAGNVDCITDYNPGPVDGYTVTPCRILFDLVLAADTSSPAHVELAALDDGRYVLQWGDYVANSWAETYWMCSVALARLAALQYCAEEEWEVGFTDGPDGFENQFADMLLEVVR